MSYQAMIRFSRQNGNATAIHWPKDTFTPALFRHETASTFCSDEIGVIIPPKLHATASPINNALEYLLFNGKSLTMGSIIAEHSIGAVWLLIHIDRMSPTNMIAKMNNCGRVPSISCKYEAMRSSSWHLLKEPEIV